MYIWRNEAHSQWAGETLYFWKISLGQSRDLNDSSLKVQDIFETNGCVSFKIYFVTGSSDLIIRSWIKANSLTEQIEKSLRKTFLNAEIEMLRVHDIAMHGIWENKSLTDFSEKLDTIGREAIEAINNSSIDDHDASSYAEYAIPFPEPKKTEISFFVFCPINAGIGLRQDSEIRRRIMEIASKAAIRTTDLSVYLHSSTRVHELIIKGTLEANEFTTKFTGFLEQINRSPNFVASHLLPTETCVILEHFGGKSHFVDKLVVDPSGQHAASSKNDLLFADESQYLECKGSFGTDLKAYHHTGKLFLNEELMDEVLEAIVGLMNTKTNGKIVIGVLEVDDKEHIEMADKQKLPTVGKRFIIGLNEFDYTVLGDTKKKTWEKFQNFLTERVENRIVPTNASSYLTIEQFTIEDRDICIIHVDSPRELTHYLKTKSGDERYYERIGPQTRRLNISDRTNR